MATKTGKRSSQTKQAGKEQRSQQLCFWILRAFCLLNFWGTEHDMKVTQGLGRWRSGKASRVPLWAHSSHHVRATCEFSWEMLRPTRQFWTGAFWLLFVFSSLEGTRFSLVNNVGKDVLTCLNLQDSQFFRNRPSGKYHHLQICLEPEGPYV